MLSLSWKEQTQAQVQKMTAVQIFVCLDQPTQVVSQVIIDNLDGIGWHLPV